MSQMSGISAALGQDQFLQLLVSQLQNQDPLDPVSDKDFINQLATLSQLQGIQDLNANFGEMLKLQQLTNGASLIGKTVEYTPADGGPTQTGTVGSLEVQNGAFVLVVGTTRIGLDQIVSVRT
jgi:flagellar basal-body rod modification protein FlgD